VIPHFDADAVRRAVPMSAAIVALREAFLRRPQHVARTHVPTELGDLLVMPAVLGSWAGVKSIVARPGTIGGLYTLFDLDAAVAVATFDGGALTEIRTPAVSAVATDALAGPHAATLGVFGTGPQAAAHIEAMRVVRPTIERIVRVGRASSEEERRAAARCDVVCTCTSSPSPVLDGSAVHDHAVVCAIGSYRRGWSELPTSLVRRSDVWVDHRDAAVAEAGDLMAAADEGWSWDELCGDLADLAAGPATRTDRPALFKSVGLAVEDLVVAQAAWAAASGASVA
jgi:ornithine cyclodeaminase/alanine dehydrogenase-like protein (mu-crystallin family)